MAQAELAFDGKDDVHPCEEKRAVNPQTIPVPMKTLVAANWAWHFRYKPAGSTSEFVFENFSDAHCLVLEHRLQKYEKSL